MICTLCTPLINKLAGGKCYIASLSIDLVPCHAIVLFPLFLPFDFLFLSLWACTTLRRFVSVNVPLLSTAGSKNQCPLWGISSTPFEAAAQTAAATSNSGGKSSGTFMASALSSSGLLMLSFGLLAATTTHTHTHSSSWQRKMRHILGK